MGNEFGGRLLLMLLKKRRIKMETILAAVLGIIIVFFAFYQLIIINQSTDDKIENIDITISYLVKKVYSLNQELNNLKLLKKQQKKKT